MNLVLFGPPGCGKGTQAAILVDRHTLCHLSTGDMLRMARQSDSVLGRQVAAIMDAGALVPDRVVIDLMAESMNTGASGYIIDGFPRTLAQAEALDAMLEARGQSVDVVVYLRVDEGRLAQRIAGRRAEEGRSDDTPQGLVARLATYSRQSEPLIRTYREQGKLVEIDGMEPIDVVAARLEESLVARGLLTGAS